MTMLIFSFTNASWLAAPPQGALKLIAARAEDESGCVTARMAERAFIDGATYLVLSPSSVLNERSKKSPANCWNRAGGFPDAFRAMPSRRFMVPSVDDAQTAATVVDAKRSLEARYGRVPDAVKEASFFRPGIAAQGIRDALPEAWIWNPERALECHGDYFKFGWLGVIPESCRAGTMVIPLDRRWQVWGWPRRFLARMQAAKIRVILGEPGQGIARAEQIPLIPRDYTGYVWVEDIAAIGPAIRR